MPEPALCPHCRQPRRGYGRTSDGFVLCHPDDGPDCYTQVTRDGHELPAEATKCGRCGDESATTKGEASCLSH